jgi:hypothetical protein
MKSAWLIQLHCRLDQSTYPAGIKVSDPAIEAVNLTRHDFHGEWTYTITPKLRTLER